MTFGSGINGCLGHGDYDDVPKVIIMCGWVVSTSFINRLNWFGLCSSMKLLT